MARNARAVSVREEDCSGCQTLVAMAAGHRSDPWQTFWHTGRNWKRTAIRRVTVA